MFVNFNQSRQFGGGQVSTLALGEEGGNNGNPQVTTLALGEEGGNNNGGGGQVTTLALGEEGGSNNGGGTATTFALGEEGGGNTGGGQVTTLALGEEGGGNNGGGQVTTLALGEEGGGNNGGGGVTTLALGEEGGGNPGQNFNIPTSAFHAVLDGADQAQSGNKDDRLSLNELNTHLTGLNQELTDLENIRFIQAPGPEFTQHVQDVRNRRDAAQILTQNFNVVGGQDANKNLISHSEIQNLANQDFNSNNVTGQDLQRLRQQGNGNPGPQQPGQPNYPPQFPQQMFSLFNQMLNFMRNFFLR